VIVLTIQPGIIFSAATVRWLRAAGFTDADVESDFNRLERAPVPFRAIAALRGYGRPAHYVAELARAALTSTVTFGGAL